MADKINTDKSGYNRHAGYVDPDTGNASSDISKYMASKQRNFTKANMRDPYDPNKTIGVDWDMGTKPGQGTIMGLELKNPYHSQYSYVYGFSDGLASKIYEKDPDGKLTAIDEQKEADKTREARTLLQGVMDSEDYKKDTAAMQQGEYKGTAFTGQILIPTDSPEKLTGYAKEASDLYKRFQAQYHGEGSGKPLNVAELERLKQLDMMTIKEFGKIETKLKAGDQLSPQEKGFMEAMKKDWLALDNSGQPQKDASGNIVYKDFKDPRVSSALSEMQLLSKIDKTDPKSNAGFTPTNGQVTTGTTPSTKPFGWNLNGGGQSAKELIVKHPELDGVFFVKDLKTGDMNVRALDTAKLTGFNKNHIKDVEKFMADLPKQPDFQASLNKSKPAWEESFKRQGVEPADIPKAVANFEDKIHADMGAKPTNTGPAERMIQEPPKAGPATNKPSSPTNKIDQ